MTKRADYDPWVNKWIETEKLNGRKCFDVKKISGSYYVYYQTTKYNSETKKREKVSAYIGKLTEKEGLIESGAKEKDMISTPRYGLGVDTGGTYTDAVIVDLDDYSVIAKKKSPTTHNDLSICLYKAIDAVLSSTDIKPSEIVSVGISTTLATNSVLEGMGGRVGLILIGWDPVEPVYFGEDKQVFVKGGYDVKGRAKESMSLEEITNAINSMKDEVDAIAISGLFANVNATQERKVKKLVSDMTGLPTVAGHELSAELGIGLRAETAVLNGKLIPIVTKFFEDVQKTLKSKGITAPIMVYKGDGSVMTVDQAKIYPVQTILSGPAASSMGGKILSGELENFVLVDVGGTSTDIAVVEEGYPQIKFTGAEIGDWKTRVKAVDMHTIAMGGDSRITLDKTTFNFGPRRVIPLCRFTSEYPEIIPDIMHTNVYDYYLLKEDEGIGEINEHEQTVIEGMKGRGPMNKMDVMNAAKGLWAIDDELEDLTNKGYIQMASLTPTDLMVFLGLYDFGNKEGARSGVHSIAEKLGMTETQAATIMMEEAKIKISEAVLTMLIGNTMTDWKTRETMMFLRRMSSKQKGDSNFDMLPKIKVPIIGVGAPSRILMDDIGERLGTTVIFPEHNEVGNAVGAVSSKVVESLSATITPTHDYRFKLEVPYLGPSYYSTIGSAISAGQSSLEAFLKNEVIKNGGHNVVATTKIKTYMATEGGFGNWEEGGIARTVNYVEVISRAVGDPPEAN